MMSKALGEFVAIDFETADYGYDSACSVAIIRVKGDKIVERTHFLIRPPRRQFVFTYLHGITWEDVENQLTFGQLWPHLIKKLNDVEFIAAHHADFDRSVLMACCEAWRVMPPRLPFKCTVQLARQVWRIYPTKLPNVCDYLGIPLKHHDAISDAEACAKIVIAARRSLIPTQKENFYQPNF